MTPHQEKLEAIRRDEDSPIVSSFKEFVRGRTGIPVDLMYTIRYEMGDFGVRVDGVGDISALKTDFYSLIEKK